LSDEHEKPPASDIEEVVERYRPRGGSARKPAGRAAKAPVKSEGKSKEGSGFWRKITGLVSAEDESGEALAISDEPPVRRERPAVTGPHAPAPRDPAAKAKGTASLPSQAGQARESDAPADAQIDSQATTREEQPRAKKPLPVLPPLKTQPFIGQPASKDDESSNAKKAGQGPEVSSKKAGQAPGASLKGGQSLSREKGAERGPATEGDAAAEKTLVYRDTEPFGSNPKIGSASTLAQSKTLAETPRALASEKPKWPSEVDVKTEQVALDNRSTQEDFIGQQMMVELVMPDGQALVLIGRLSAFEPASASTSAELPAQGGLSIELSPAPINPPNIVGALQRMADASFGFEEKASRQSEAAAEAVDHGEGYETNEQLAVSVAASTESKPTMQAGADTESTTDSDSIPTDRGGAIVKSETKPGVGLAKPEMDVQVKARPHQLEPSTGAQKDVERDADDSSEPSAGVGRQTAESLDTVAAGLNGEDSARVARRLRRSKIHRGGAAAPEPLVTPVNTAELPMPPEIRAEPEAGEISSLAEALERARRMMGDGDAAADSATDTADVKSASAVTAPALPAATMKRKASAPPTAAPASEAPSARRAVPAAPPMAPRRKKAVPLAKPDSVGAVASKGRDVTRAAGEVAVTNSKRRTADDEPSIVVADGVESRDGRAEDVLPEARPMSAFAERLSPVAGDSSDDDILGMSAGRSDPGLSRSRSAPSVAKAGAETKEKGGQSITPTDPKDFRKPGHSRTPTQSTSPIVGIDFGTSYSCVALVRAGFEMISGQQGDLMIPSVVSFPTAGEVVVGAEAKKRMAGEAQWTVASPKRLLGRPYKDPQVDSLVGPLAMRTFAGTDQFVRFEAHGDIYSVTDICAMILSKLRERACRHLGTDVSRAVFAVPVAFGSLQRSALELAAKQAGLQGVALLTEPSAALLAHGFRKRAGLVAVYDFGGGTFDFCVVEVSKTTFKVLCAGGDPWLGGDDFDNTLASLVADRFWKDSGVDLRDRAVEWQSLVFACEAAKRQLSVKTSALVQVDNLVHTAKGAKGLKYKIARKDFVSAVSDLIERSTRITTQVMSQAGISPRDVNAVVMTGGTSLIPAVREAVTQMFKRKPVAGDSELAVVRGAALRAAELAGEKMKATPMAGRRLQEVAGRTIGASIQEGVVETIFERDTQLPAEHKHIFRTVRDNQTDMVVTLYEGSKSRIDERHILGQLRYRGLRARPAGQNGISFTFILDEDGLLHVTAIVEGRTFDKTIRLE
jgi:molecular chaperone DnaK